MERAATQASLENPLQRAGNPRRGGGQGEGDQPDREERCTRHAGLCCVMGIAEALVGELAFAWGSATALSGARTRLFATTARASFHPLASVAKPRTLRARPFEL